MPKLNCEAACSLAQENNSENLKHKNWRLEHILLRELLLFLKFLTHDCVSHDF